MTDDEIVKEIWKVMLDLDLTDCDKLDKIEEIFTEEGY